MLHLKLKPYQEKVCCLPEVSIKRIRADTGPGKGGNPGELAAGYCSNNNDKLARWVGKENT